MDGYPKVKYHMRGGGSICVTSPEQEKALGSEWIDNKRIEVKNEVLRSGGQALASTAEAGTSASTEAGSGSEAQAKKRNGIKAVSGVA